MSSSFDHSHLHFERPIGSPFPPEAAHWPAHPGVDNLVAIGGDLSPNTIISAYRAGIFPWFNEGQPILWWSTDPRLVLPCQDFKLHRSLKQHIRAWYAQGGRITFDQAFPQVIQACAETVRPDQQGTWIVPRMQEAYCNLHQLGYAHSVEVWQDENLIGGLYCINLGKAVCGESMFSRQAGASKIALSALVHFCQTQCIDGIDCQQDTPHLRFMGAQLTQRSTYVHWLRDRMDAPPPSWHMDMTAWMHWVLQSRSATQ